MKTKSGSNKSTGMLQKVFHNGGVNIYSALTFCEEYAKAHFGFNSQFAKYFKGR